jgi:putative Ca2+/H+ antiporter (TMEM165/GDT1 family)
MAGAVGWVHRETKRSPSGSSDLLIRVKLRQTASGRPASSPTTPPPVDAFLISTAVIFVAELGDKSQLMALTFATRFKSVPVLVGITGATAIVHAVSVFVGAALGAAFPSRPVTIAAAIAFVGFGLWTLRGDQLTADDRARAAAIPARHAVMTVGTVFFLAELGDKTMVATVTLATKEGLFGTWLGSTVGMVAADALAIVTGSQLGARLPDRTIRIGAAIAFFAFAALLLIEAL